MRRNPRPIAVLSDLANATLLRLTDDALAAAPDPRGRFRDNFPVWDWMTKGGRWVVPTTPTDTRTRRNWQAVLMARTPVRIQGIRQVHDLDVFLIGLFDANATRNATYKLPYAGLQDHKYGVALVVPAFQGFADLHYPYMVNTLVHEFAHVADDVPRKRYARQEKQYWQHLIEHNMMTVEQVANTAGLAHHCYAMASEDFAHLSLGDAIRYALDDSYLWAELQSTTTDEIKRRTILAVVRYFQESGWPPAKARKENVSLRGGDTLSEVGPAKAPEMDWDD